MVGRLDARKGHDVVLEALARASVSAEEVYLDIVGDGSLRRRLSERSRELPVTLHGSLSAASTVELYRRADMFLAPAQYGESFGVVLLEAMAAGCPLIASDIAGYRDVLAGSGAGILVAPDDPDAWAAAIQELAAEPERRSVMGRCGELHAARFSWDLIAGEMERVYEEALGGTLTESSDRSFARSSAPLPDEMAAVTPRG
jgi:phosphatidylinositol alpha-mannosyltransferase